MSRPDAERGRQQTRTRHCAGSLNNAGLDFPGPQRVGWLKPPRFRGISFRLRPFHRLREQLRLRRDGDEIDAIVYDACADSDCDGCCTDNSWETGFLIDIEKYTMQRFGHGAGTVEWACLDCP